MNTYVIHNARLTADPETKTFGERMLTELRVADNPMRKTNSKGEEIPARFVTLKVWGKQAEGAAKLSKGDVIVATGTLGLEQYTNKQGQLVSKDVVDVSGYTVAQSETFYGRNKDAGKIPF